MGKLEYATIPMDAVGLSQMRSTPSHLILYVAAGMGLLWMCIGTLPLATHYWTAVDTSVNVRASSIAMPRHAASLERHTTSQISESTVNLLHPAMPELPSSSNEFQGSTSWTSAMTFICGCMAAAAAMALSLRRQTLNNATWTEECCMATALGHQEVTEIPEVLVMDEDENSFRRQWEQMLRRAQESICKAIEECDGQGKFRTDAWLRDNGGGGISRVMTDGKVWEKAGIGLSVIYGLMPTETLILARKRQANYAKDLNPGEKVPFFTCGLSCVMHPRNPHCPTIHFNYRYFATEAGDWWFGGGTDITPAYLDEEDMRRFHGSYKEICDKHDPNFYAKYKKWADEYFMIKHRGETRGLGGIFFDDLNDRDPEKIFAFAEECLNNVVASYVPIIEKHMNDPFTEEQKRWQQMRRGRYVEFNLVYDRGFVFGLKSGLGRIETMMMTLPETARWEYNYQPAPGSEEEKITKYFRQSPEWV